MSESESFKCDACDYKTDRKQNYDRHLKSQLHKKNANIEIKEYECKICEYKTPRSSNFTRHNQSKFHLNKKNGIENKIDYSCKLCSFQTKIKTHYEQHKQSKKHIELLNNQDINRVYECNKCGFLTSSLSEVKSHIKRDGKLFEERDYHYLKIAIGLSYNKMENIINRIKEERSLAISKESFNKIKENVRKRRQKVRDLYHTLDNDIDKQIKLANMALGYVIDTQIDEYKDIYKYWNTYFDEDVGTKYAAKYLIKIKNLERKKKKITINDPDLFSDSEDENSENEYVPKEDSDDSLKKDSQKEDSEIEDSENSEKEDSHKPKEKPKQKVKAIDI